VLLLLLLHADSLVLHSPLDTFEATMEVWRVFEAIWRSGRVRFLGISNTDLRTLTRLYEEASVKPSVVQNRFYPATQFDSEIRQFCRERGLFYQSFWTLSANPILLKRSVSQSVNY
jgi:diketogulonate reductase-like aldo/keto reductase